MGICSNYRRALSFTEVIEMPIDYILTLRYLIYKNNQKEKDKKAAEALEDELEELM